MNKLLFLICSLCLLVVCQNENPVSENNCICDGFREIKYLSNGHVANDAVYDKNYVKRFYYSYNYNSTNTITSHVIYNPDGTVIGYINYKLNSVGDATIDSILDADHVLYAYRVNTYDQDDRLLSVSYYLANNTLKNVYDYYYDSNNRMSKIEKYDEADNLLETTTYERNSSGTLVLSTDTDSAGKKTGYSEYTYISQTYTVKITYYVCTPAGAKRNSEINWEFEQLDEFFEGIGRETAVLYK